jgi:hypothetical protein
MHVELGPRVLPAASPCRSLRKVWWGIRCPRTANCLSPLIRSADSGYTRLAGGQPRALLGIEPGEDPIRWSGDGKYLFVVSEEIPASVYRVEILTGRQRLVYKLAPKDAAGLWDIWPVLITPDGKSYVYSEYKILSDLYLANGLR